MMAGSTTRQSTPKKDVGCSLASITTAMRRSPIMRLIALLLLGASSVQAKTDDVEVICGQESVGDVAEPLMCKHNSELASSENLAS